MVAVDTNGFKLVLSESMFSFESSVELFGSFEALFSLCLTVVCKVLLTFMMLFSGELD